MVSLNEFYKRRGDDVNFLSTARQLFEASDIPLETKIDFFKEITSSKDFYRANFFQINNLISDLAIKNPNDFRITQLYGNHLISSGNLEGALQLYKSHVTDSAPQREVFTEILDMESYLKHPDSVAKYTTLALEKFPSDPEFYLRKGFGMFYFMEDYAGAEKEFLKALKLTRTDSLRSVIYGTLGDNRQKMEDGPGAYGYYRKGLKYDPDNSMILNNYSYYLSEKRRKNCRWPIKCLKKPVNCRQTTRPTSTRGPGCFLSWGGTKRPKRSCSRPLLWTKAAATNCSCITGTSSMR